jgi:hypothetical protein
MYTRTDDLIKTHYKILELPGEEYAPRLDVLFEIVNRLDRKPICPTRRIQIVSRWRLGYGKNLGMTTIKQADIDTDVVVNEDLEEYQDGLIELIALGSRGEITREEFESRWLELTEAILILMLLLGSEREELTVEQESEVSQQMERAQAGMGEITRQVFAGEYVAQEGEEEPQRNILAKVLLWVNTAIGMFWAGLSFLADDPWLQWELGKADHCRTCLALNGIIMRASDWARSPFKPRITNGALACGGYNCKCRLSRVENPGGVPVGTERLPMPSF